MKSSASCAALALAVSSVVLLAGCGGSGDSTSSNPTSKIASAITKDNAKDVGAQAYWAIDILNRQIDTSIIDVTDATASSSCNSGSSTRTVDGTTITFADTNCDNGAWITNGTTTIKLSDVTGNPFSDPAWSGTVTITFTDFKARLSADIATSLGIDMTSSENGNLIFQYHQTAPHTGVFSTSDASNNLLQWRITSGNSTIERNISTLAYSGSLDASNLNTFNAAFALSGKLGKLGNDASYAIKTTTEFKRQTSSGQVFSDPTQGVMSITTSDKSSLTFTTIATADAKTAVQLGVDRDGNSTIDDGTTTTWLELNSLAYRFN